MCSFLLFEARIRAECFSELALGGLIALALFSCLHKLASARTDQIPIAVPCLPVRAYFKFVRVGESPEGLQSNAIRPTSRLERFNPEQKIGVPFCRVTACNASETVQCLREDGQGSTRLRHVRALQHTQYMGTARGFGIA